MASPIASNGLDTLMNQFNQLVTTIVRLQSDERTNPKGVTVLNIEIDIVDGKLVKTFSGSYGVEEQAHKFLPVNVQIAPDYFLDDEAADASPVDVYYGDDAAAEPAEEAPAA